MSLWVDKHRPTQLIKLDYHKEQATYLKKLVRRSMADKSLNDNVCIWLKQIFEEVSLTSLFSSRQNDIAARWKTIVASLSFQNKESWRCPFPIPEC